MELSSVTYPPPSRHKAWDHKSLRQNLGQGRSLRNQLAEFPSIYSHRARGHCPLLLHIRVYLLGFPQDCWTGWQWGSKQANTSVEEQQLCRQADCPGASPQHWLGRYFRKRGSEAVGCWALDMLSHSLHREASYAIFSLLIPQRWNNESWVAQEKAWLRTLTPRLPTKLSWTKRMTKPFHKACRTQETQFTVLLVSSLRPTVTVLGHYRNPKV